MNKILIIEDDLEINALLADFLKEKGYAVHCQYDGLHVLDFLNKGNYSAPRLGYINFWSKQRKYNFCFIIALLRKVDNFSM